jgi:hypothetical protein
MVLPDMVLYHEACWSAKIDEDVNAGLYAGVREGWLEVGVASGRRF